ncbi:MAG: hypothetical protein ACLRWM_04290 [Streptococcus sp.]
MIILQMNSVSYPKRFNMISEENPIVITRTCGHILVNSKAIELANITVKQSRRYFDLDAGLFKKMLYLIYDNPQPTIEEIKDNILIAQKELHSYGITSVQSDDLLSATSDYHDALQAFEN